MLEGAKYQDIFFKTKYTMQYFDGGGLCPLTAKYQVKSFRLNIICSALMEEGKALRQQSTNSIYYLD